MYRIKKTVKLFQNKNKIKFIFMNIHQEITIKCNEVCRFILSLLAIGIVKSSLFHQVKKKYPKVSEQDINSFLKFLITNQIIEEFKESKYENSIVSRQVNFYSTIVPNSESMQDELSNKCVLILGLGGVGSCISYFLAQAGISHFIFVDSDKVENTNLGRQALYFKDDIGKYKVDVISNKLRKLNPNLIIEKHKFTVQSKEDFMKIKHIPDIVVNCLDEPNSYFTGTWVNNYYLGLDIPMINGIGYRGRTISLGLTTIPGKTICWNCANASYKNAIKGYVPILNHNPQAGVTSPLANFIGSIHAQEVINILCKELTPILTNRIGVIDFLTLDIKWYKLTINSTNCCPICRRRNNI